jgi:PAS domain S-box-containing protein
MFAEDDVADLPFRQLAQHLPVLCWISDAAGAIIWVNDAWLAYCGKDPEALSREGLAQLHDPAVWPEVRRRWAEARTAEQPADMVFPLKDRDGGFRPFHTRVVPLRDAEGRVTRWFGTNTDISQQAEAEARARRSEATLAENEERLRLATEAAEVGLWDVDPLSDRLFWPPRVKAMFGISPDAPVSMSDDFFPCLHPEDRARVVEAYAAAVDPARRDVYDVEYRTVGKEDGLVRWVAAKGRGLFNERDECYRVVGTAMDVTARKQDEQAAQRQAYSLAVLNETGAAVAAELDLTKIVQLVTDAGVGITAAQFGAFFYNLTDEAGESYMLYALSGVERSAFDRFPMPRNTAVFAPTFSGEGVVKSDDITQDPRYGRNAPRSGMPEGHLPVRSYLAVPVISRSGEVLGGLFFGHSERAIFSDAAAELVRGVAGQAAVAIDNARLYEAAQREIDQRRRSEDQQRLLIDELNHRVKNTLATVQSIVAQTSRAGRSAEDVRTAVEARLLALSHAHDLLTRHNWQGADLVDVVQRAMAPFAPGSGPRIQAGGPPVALAPQQALAISMALHELATNAAKYGALCVATGSVSISWTATDQAFEVVWEERDGPPVRPPASQGFGTRLLQRGLARDLRGDVDMDFRATGLRCVIRAPHHAPSQPLRLGPAGASDLEMEPKPV